MHDMGMPYVLVCMIHDTTDRPALLHLSGQTPHILCDISAVQHFNVMLLGSSSSRSVGLNLCF
jgi:hypothetical protein